MGVSPAGIERGAAVELARRGLWSVNAVVTNRSAGAGVARDLLQSPLIDVAAQIGAGYYWEREKVLPNAGLVLRFCQSLGRVNELPAAAAARLFFYLIEVERAKFI